MNPAERLRRYRKYVYEAGAIPKPGDSSGQTIGSGILQQEQAAGFDLNRIRRFRLRTRYFTDSGIIGTQAFVAAQYQIFKRYFISKNEKIPKPIKGIEGIYSLKGLSESIQRAAIL